jgi:integrase/recombinase XerC
VPAKRYSGLEPQSSPDCLSIDELREQIEGWALDAQNRHHSPRTLAQRRFIAGRLLWWLTHTGRTHCGRNELRGFFGYLYNAHETPAGRWESGRKTPLRPTSALHYHSYLASLFAFIVAEGVLPESPMTRVHAPEPAQDQVQPFSPEQIRALLGAAGRSPTPTRDTALVLFLLDSGARASEACALTRGDVNLSARRVSVIGKGNKRRSVYFHDEAARALWRLLRTPGADTDPLFRAASGYTPGAALTPNGLSQIIRRLGIAAGIEGVRCSCHTLRHSFAVSFLRAGGHMYALQEMLGHTTLEMVRRYVKLADADVAEQHREHSPVQHILRGKHR